ncbi:MAG: alpha/beta hydrolase [Actinobacteria bacterium]|nr:alpha/beta hydrolase [Actinomycetota bacterium]
MARVSLPSGIEIEFEEFGVRSDPTVLLVSGFTSQLLGWDEGLCHELAASGRHVIRFDNRDVGLSSHLDGQAVDVEAVFNATFFGGDSVEVPYTLSDMAADAIGLIDALDCEVVDAVGVSMGGMIVQTMAIEHPDRLHSVVSVMSTTGDPSVGRSAPEAMEALLAPPPTDRDAYIDSSSRWAIWASKRYYDAERARRKSLWLESSVG